ncbi:hypothetical protein AMAG_11569 [Allomyces macrogynus ATCC 38327]|uniref:Transmembrane protein n=1 Tax=Allomyces macrogynus (strain ATCC 38327) TaxID=578462 RepID=A0A0L0SVD2_ALLM3|nr:hypothetical protein AMAG_11569 [Allomyces macrogynus ATCC 38327]|eukprot:KNE66431.1 hypothetical protein AMAG_11569 [Allomyces macrogynus ATCC 38327]
MSAETLLGPVEFAIWQTLTRAGGAVALIVRLIYLTVFAANTIIQALIKDKLLNETTWVRTVDLLTEAEVMSMSFADQSSVDSPADVNQWIKDPTAMSPSFSVAPDLDPSMGPTNPPAKAPPSRTTTLQYMDYAQVISIGDKGQDSKSGTATAVLASLDPARTAKGEFEHLTFDTLTSTTKGALKVTSLLSVSDALVASGKLTAKKLSTQMALSSIAQTCTPSRISVGSFVVKKTIDLAKEESSAGFTVPSSNEGVLGAEVLNGAQVCRTVVHSSKIPAGFEWLGSLVAAQRSDFIVATQIVQRDVQCRVRCMDHSVMVDATEQLKLDPDLRAEPRPKRTMGLLSRWLGTDTVADNGFSDTHDGGVEIRLDAANSGGLVADGSSSDSSWTDPDGPQHYFLNAVRVCLWDVIASLVLMVTPIALGIARLATLFDTVVMQHFLFADLRPRARQLREARGTF